jgi:hypothetical protein
MINVQRGDNESAWVSFFKELLIVAAFNSAIAAFITLLGVGDLLNSMGFAQSIGLSIFLLSRAICFHRGTKHTDWKTAAIAIPLGACAGMVVGSLINGIAPATLLHDNPGFILATSGVALVFGTTISYYFYTRGLLAETAADLQRQRSERLLGEQRLSEARLKLLQAQIEPHFLFNTLSNVLSLIHSDAATAEHMLEELTRYLRATFQATRRDEVPLREELALIGNYLAIQEMRMGERLSYDIEVTEELRTWPVPPFLLQPLVENAVKHGIEPEAGKGQIAIRARRVAEGLELEVSDSGPGIAANSAPGLGQANVRERLQAKYGAAASLRARTLVPRGCRVTLLLPAGGA